MLNIERRLAALEARTSDDGVKIVILNDGDTQANALKRVGLTLRAPRVVCVAPLDARL